MYPIFLKKDTYIKHFSKIWSANYEDTFFLVYHIKSSVWSLERLLPLSTKNLLYLLPKLSTLKKISLHAPRYNIAVTTEAARPSVI